MKSRRIKIFLIFCILFSAVIFFTYLLNLFINNYTKNYIIEDLSKLNTWNFQAVMILWARINSDWSLAAMLKDRADTAIDLYKEKKVKKIIISADNSTFDYNEVIPTKRYVISAGIPAEDIFLDFAWFDTYDSMYRAKYIFWVDSLLISTQDFHLPRSIRIARMMGLNATGVVANKHDYQNIEYNHFREFFANVKATYRLITHSKSHHLWEQIPIIGTWNAVYY